MLLPLKVNQEEATEEEVPSEEKEEITMIDQEMHPDISRDITHREVEIEEVEPPTVALESLPEVAKLTNEHQLVLFL